ncbi:hypothetical protein [Candidatus Liberibacter solanacearum]|uniref:Outer membrane protein beta-barrel domain-containing protein n=1 Tax=Candidatus Liberibacter solanacearum TaxID=556287 RepID=A0A1V2N7I3_9HYPH|nr:hypothetical protein [Candidatus Liberibacter solanacearum]ONI58843.1 hypothetical protein AYO25_04635 [Candidatus Liberibacter solanacearum]ONI59489.1 hypothetical protein AYJ09_04045 [Candidatus Liberibacter solanacearum]
MRAFALGLCSLLIFTGYPAFAESTKKIEHVVSFPTPKYGVKSSYHPFAEVHGSKKFSSVEIGYRFPLSIYGRSFFTGEIEKLISYGMDVSIGMGKVLEKNEVSKFSPLVSFSSFLTLYESHSVSVLFNTKLGLVGKYTIFSLGPELTYKIKDRFSVGINISPYIIRYMDKDDTAIRSLSLGFNIQF